MNEAIVNLPVQGIVTFAIVSNGNRQQASDDQPTEGQLFPLGNQ